VGKNRYLKNAKSLEVQEMAMTGEIHTGVIILRTSVKQTISAAGWSRRCSHIKGHGGLSYQSATARGCAITSAMWLGLMSGHTTAVWIIRSS